MTVDKPEVKGNAIPPQRPPMQPAIAPTTVPSSVHLSDVQAALQFAEKRGTVDLMALPNGMPIAAIPAGKQISSLKSFVDEWMDRPPRHYGQSTHLTLASFISHVNRFKLENSVVFANGNANKPQLMAVYNYRKTDLAEFGDWTALLNCELSEPWKIWSDANKEGMSQNSFAGFIEEHVDDLLDAPDLSNPENKSLADLSKLLGYTFAGKVKMLELSRGIQINENSKAKQIVALASGEGQIEYVSEHNDATGQRLKIPGLFLIGVPVFKDGPVYRIAVRLRYRLNEGRLTWFFDMYRPDRVFDDAYGDIVKSVGNETNLPVFLGSPE